MQVKDAVQQACETATMASPPPHTLPRPNVNEHAWTQMTYTPTGVDAQVPARLCAMGHAHHTCRHHTPHQQTQMACNTPRSTRPMALYPLPPSSGVYDGHTRPSRPKHDTWHHSCLYMLPASFWPQTRIWTWP